MLILNFNFFAIEIGVSFYWKLPLLYMIGHPSQKVQIVVKDGEDGISIEGGEERCNVKFTL